MKFNSKKENNQLKDDVSLFDDFDALDE